MKIDRLMGILILLLQRGHMTAPQLAERFEVSRRTIIRDLDALCRAGVPLVTIQGYHGGVAIAEGYRLDPSLFTDEELQTIFAGVQGVSSAASADSARSILEKLTREDRATAEQYLTIDLSSFDPNSLALKTEAIKNAILERRLLTFSYCSPKGSGVRTVEPCRLLFQLSSWYLFAYCTQRQDFRFFRLDRMWELKALEETFTPREVRPEQLTFREYFSQKNFSLKAVFDPDARYRLIEEYGPDSFTVREDGGLLLERDFASYENLRGWILSFGDAALVLEPQELREEIVRRAQNTLRRYEEQDT